MSIWPKGKKERKKENHTNNFPRQLCLLRSDSVQTSNRLPGCMIYICISRPGLLASAGGEDHEDSKKKRRVNIKVCVFCFLASHVISWSPVSSLHVDVLPLKCCMFKKNEDDKEEE